MTKTNARILTEDVIALGEVSNHLPNRPHLSTVWRWAKRGIRGFKLETYKLGSRDFTSVQAVHRFLEATQTEVEA